MIGYGYGEVLSQRYKLIKIEGKEIGLKFIAISLYCFSGTSCKCRYGIGHTSVDDRLLDVAIAV